jgi:hypothetical protein
VGRTYNIFMLKLAIYIVNHWALIFNYAALITAAKSDEYPVRHPQSVHS